MKLYREHLGKVLKAERLNQERNMRSVAANAYISISYLSELENGKKEVSSDILKNLCNALFMSVQDVLIDVVISMNQEAEEIQEIKEIELTV